MNAQAYYEKLKAAVIDMDEDGAAEIAGQIVADNLDAKLAISQALIPAMEEVSALYAAEQYFIPDLLICADAMYAAMDILSGGGAADYGGNLGKTIVIGTVAGDTHDIGKNIVALFFKSAGFVVVDIGRDISAAEFVDNAVAHNADIIAVSTIMTTTMNNIGDIVTELQRRGLRENFKLIIGGKPISLKFARQIGADGYAVNAADAIKLAKKLCGIMAE
ncbi:MAG: cobalamin-dependent protein [Oscillospiraceae bacterium]